MEDKSSNKHDRMHLIPESLGLLKSTKEGLLVLCGKKNVANHILEGEIETNLTTNCTGYRR